MTRKSEHNRARPTWVIIHYTQAREYLSHESVTSLRRPTQYAHVHNAPEGYEEIYEITSGEVRREVDCLLIELNRQAREQLKNEIEVPCHLCQEPVLLSFVTPLDNEGAEGTQRYACHECMREDTKEDHHAINHS